MLSHSLKGEITWFLLGLGCSFLVGAIVGFAILSAIFFLIGYCLWLLYRMDQIVSWLREGALAAKAPPTAGLTNEMVQRIHREKKYSRKQKNRYKKALAQFKSLAADLPDATVVLNERREIRWSNPAARTLLDIHPERDRGQRIDNLLRIPEFRAFLSDPPGEAELEIPSPSTPDRTLVMRMVPTNNKLTVLIAADITQRVQLRKMRKAFVADVSHELRTPLTVIQGYLEMLLENDEIDLSVAEALQQVAKQSDRMRHIVDHLLELSKLEANPMGESEGDAVDVADMIRAMATTLEQGPEKHRFVLDLDNSLALLGSEREIYSACNNLMANAVKYTDPGSTITVSWRLEENGMPVYCVSDNGPGIEARHLPRLSERFYRVDPGRSRENGGTGLGLAIVKHAAQRHGGGLEIESTPGTGSTFRIKFPAARALHTRLAANQ